MVNLSFRQAAVPSAWKVSTVIPIYKSGDKSNLSNYRPISILSITSKVAEKRGAKLLTNHLNNGFISLFSMQFGFNRNYSTESTNCLFVEKVKCLLDKECVCWCCLFRSKEGI